jgi:hypothetical protein
MVALHGSGVKCTVERGDPRHRLPRGQARASRDRQTPHRGLVWTATPGPAAMASQDAGGRLVTGGNEAATVIGGEAPPTLLGPPATRALKVFAPAVPKVHVNW